MKRPGKKRRLFALLLLGLLGFGGFLIFRPTGPTYNGKSLRYWFRQYCLDSPVGLEQETPEQVLEKFGTNALPFLVEQALSTSKDTALRTNFYAWLAKLPDSWHLPAFISHDDMRDKAVIMISDINPPAEVTLPFVTDALKSQNEIRRSQAVEILSNVETNAASLAPYFGNALHFDCADKGRDSRSVALIALAKLGIEAKPALPDLIWMLNKVPATSDLYMRAVGVLGNIGPDAVGGLPTLAAAFETDTNWWQRCELATALCRIDARQSKPLEFLIEALDEPNEQPEVTPTIQRRPNSINTFIISNTTSACVWPRPTNRARNAAEQLGKVGPNARVAIPALLNAIDGTNEGVWEAAPMSLQKLGAPNESFIPKLKNRLKSNSSDIRFLVARIILKLDPVDSDAQSVMVGLIKNRSELAINAWVVLRHEAGSLSEEAKLTVDEAEKMGYLTRHSQPPLTPRGEPGK